MDELSRIWFRTECRDRLRNAQGNTFQDLFSDLMELAYPRDFQRIRPYVNQGDQKCDGYLASRKAVFQVYAPRTMRQAELIAKARDDFAGAVLHWRDRMAVWAFVHNDRDGLPPQAFKVIHDLAAQDADVSVEIWGPSDIETTALNLSGDALTRVLGPAPTNRSLEELRYDRLRDVLRSIKRLPPPPIAEIRPVSVEKLEANAFSDDVLFLLRRGRRKEALVATLLRDWPTPGFAEELAEGFRRRYAELKALPGITADEIFGSLQDHTRGSEPLSDPGHQAAVLAVLSYFFERCDIFEDKPGGDSP